MDIQGSKVIGLKVVTVDTGKEIEDVDDLLYSPTTQSVFGLLVKNKGLFSEALIIPLNEVQSIGEDAVMVGSENVLKKSSQLPTSVASLATSNQYLTQTKVITETGDELGQVSDIFFDLDSGRVSEFEVSQGTLKNMQSGKKRVQVGDVVTVGPDATIVKTYTEAALETQQGGITGAVKDTAAKARGKYEDLKTDPRTGELKAKTQGVLTGAKTKAQEGSARLKAKATSVMDDPGFKAALENIKDKAGDVGEEIKANAQKMVDKTKQTAAAVSNTAQEKVENMDEPEETTVTRETKETIITPEPRRVKP